MRSIGIIEEIERLKVLDKEDLINQLIHAKVEISYLKAINSNDELNRTIYKGIDLYYSQEFVDEIQRCNSDYYNQINTLSSKLARIRELCEYEITNPDSLKEDIMEIINDKNIKIGSDIKSENI